ncbi:hypothetical protein AMD27_07035 [Acinetobacter sp. TGL-Y2]|uniref:hypothetical protein n=1 Tax=Acinetobacter sp. TGL-Y2 TaxID=1407071 RepID=UPI0007A6724E|nr:hypothetical protein [Acinetobacter sp. TGL-Y2]AMW80364.1 hypothetical protein AMD27_07035 [Acinetobacter sp. TGL-Y2]
MTMGCNSSTQLSPTVPSNLMQPTAKLQKLETGEGKSILPWAIDTVAKYNQCSAQVDAFIELNKPSK